MDVSQKLLAIEEIKQLKARYFRLMDTKDWTGMSTIFTADGVLDARSVFSVDGVPDEAPAAESRNWLYEGGQTIVDFIRDAAMGTVTCHHGHCHEVEVLSNTEAKGVIAMEDRVFKRIEGKPVWQFRGCGHYHESYRKVDGAWRIAHSRITRIYIDFTP